MKQDINHETLAELTEMSLAQAVKPAFKYTVFVNSEDEALMETNSLREAVEYLLNYSKFKKEGEAFYSRHRETLWNEADCFEFIVDNFEDVCHWSGFRIEENKNE